MSQADGKRLRPSFLNEAEQTVLLAQLHGPSKEQTAPADDVLVLLERAEEWTRRRIGGSWGHDR